VSLGGSAIFEAVVETQFENCVREMMAEFRGIGRAMIPQPSLQAIDIGPRLVRDQNTEHR
jgi:hypothetical protein